MNTLFQTAKFIRTSASEEETYFSEKCKHIFSNILEVTGDQRFRDTNMVWSMNIIR